MTLSGKEVNSVVPAGPAVHIEPTQLRSPSCSTSSDGDDFAKPPRRLGKLTTLPGSTTASVIYLSNRMTSWGRDPRSKDVRVPKRALQITFWAPGVEKRIEGGEDWMTAPGICTIVSTSTSRCIWINDIELRAESNEGDARLYGKIYTGDIITIFKSHGPKEGYLKFKVEIGYGDSARKRPENEQGFQIKRETVHHWRALRKRAVRRMGGRGRLQPLPTTGL